MSRHYEPTAKTKNLLRRQEYRRTQGELAQLFGVSTTRIRQLDRSALTKLRRAIVREPRDAGMTVDAWLGVE